MPPRDVRLYLEDIRVAAERIARLTTDKTLQSYAADENLQLTVERSFEIIGEALSHAIEIDESLGQTITGARRVIDFRNFIIHAYHAIDHAIVWGIIEGYLPALRREIEDELKKRSAPPDAI